MMAKLSPGSGKLRALSGIPNPRGADDSQLYLLSGNPVAGPIKAIVPDEGVVLPRRSPALAQDDFFLCIYHFNDLHGHLARITPLGEEPVFSRMAGQINMARRKFQDDPDKAILVMAAGDDCVGSIFDELLDEKHQTEPIHASYHLYSSAGVDAVVLGNHDFDMGAQLLAESIKRDARFPLLAANIAGCQALEGLCYPAAILQVKGVRIGIIGVVTPAEFTCHDSKCQVINPVPVVNNLVPALRPHCDVLIVLSHLGYNLDAGTALTQDAGDVELAQNLPAGSVDLIIGGHTHHALNTEGLSPDNIVNGIPIVQAGSLGRFLGKVDITIQKQSVSISNVRLLPLDSLPIDQHFEEHTMQPLISRVRSLYSQSIGVVEDDPNLSTDVVRNSIAARELALANFISDALATRLRSLGHEVDFAMIDASNVLGGLPVGKSLTLGDWFNLMPFADTIRLYQMTGNQVKALLQDNAFRIDYPGEPHTERGFLQFSRQLRYQIVRGNSRAEARASEIMVGGVALEDQLDQNFIVAGTSFNRELAAKWEKKCKQQQTEYALIDLRGIPSIDTDIFLRKELVTYIQEQGGVTQAGGAKLDDRLRVTENEKIPIALQTVNQFVNEVSGQNHAMAGAVIALSAAQAVALGQACMQITQSNLADRAEVTESRIGQCAEIKNELLKWCQEDADAIAKFVALREAGQELAGKKLLCHAPATVCELAIQAAQIFQDFRPLVFERVHDDLEMSIRLSSGTAQAALLLLDSNLRIWPEKELLAEFEPVLDALLSKLDQLSPVNRIRK